MSEKFIKSVVKTIASEDLDKKVKKELDNEDPILIKAKAIIEDNQKDGNN